MSYEHPAPLQRADAVPGKTSELAPVNPTLLPSNTEWQSFAKGRNTQTNDIKWCDPDFRYTGKGNNREMEPTEKRLQFDRWAYDSLNGPERPAPADLTPEEKKHSEDIAKLAKEIQDKGLDDKDRDKNLKSLSDMIKDLVFPEGQRVLDAVNATLKDSHARIAFVPQTGEVWMGNSGSKGSYFLSVELKEASLSCK